MDDTNAAMWDLINNEEDNFPFVIEDGKGHSIFQDEMFQDELYRWTNERAE